MKKKTNKDIIKLLGRLSSKGSEEGKAVQVADNILQQMIKLGLIASEEANTITVSELSKRIRDIPSTTLFDAFYKKTQEGKKGKEH